MRPLSACVACRRVLSIRVLLTTFSLWVRLTFHSDRRKRCDRPRRGTSCKFCIRRGFQCTVEQRSDAPSSEDGYEPLVSVRRDGAPPISAAALMPDQDLCNELVDLYFRYIHITFHNLFHSPSFKARVRDGSIPKVLLFGVFGLAARFSSHPSLAHIDPKHRGRSYAKECERLLDLHKTCLTTIQACILLGANQVVEMDSVAESIFYTIACRMAMILDLPNMPAKSLIEQEVNLRVWWSAVATDTWSSTGLGLPRAIQPRYDIPMPMDERVFLRLTPAEPPVVSQRGLDRRLRPDSDLSTSLIAQMIKLNGILYEINALNAKAASDDRDSARVRDSSVADLSAALDSWHTELPPDMEYTPDNLHYWADQGCGTAFVVLHLNFHHAGQLLFYRFLHSSLAPESHQPPSPSPFSHTNTNIGLGISSNSTHYAARCQSHAAHLCDIMYSASGQQPPEDPRNNINNNKTSSKIEVRHPLAGHMLVVASSVHTYSLLFSTDEAEIARARARLERSFGVVSRLRIYWPSLAASFSRLAAVHAACLGPAALPNGSGGGSRGSGDSGDGGDGKGAFRLDRWMVRFLVDFAKPVDFAERERP
ncbi:hypothetical protein N657DRAFT_674704 [Parathielavia appendiculata]|uniref:Xylanolytic transcriptional activator regulatory domain-containing protein n=1 Tax=Parathielavia appendiculata TaxID=2587402 RepID=A0AAN6YZC8_9PEZI|nr:hypothetical protein N657DRAFT_674704 [Parathielavia appendiculata]